MRPRVTRDVTRMGLMPYGADGLLFVSAKLGSDREVREVGIVANHWFGWSRHVWALRRAVAGLAVVALATVSLPSVASAQTFEKIVCDNVSCDDVPGAACGNAANYEDCWHSFIERWSSCCKNSRTWTDTNHTLGDTRVQFKGCHESFGGAFTDTTVQLTRETAWFQPDKDLGQKTFACKVSKWRDWPKEDRAGDYHFTVVKINGTKSCNCRLDVPDVDVWY